jgi:hypothetical protein
MIPLIAVSLLSGCGKGTTKNVKIDGVKDPTVGAIDNKLTMAVVLENVSFDGGGRIPIPKMPNSYVEVGPDLQSEGMLISVGVDMRDIAALTHGAINVLDPLTLPGGRPLPGIAQGWMPGLAVQVPKWDNIVFYLGTNLFGTFIPVKLPWQNYMGTFRFYADNNQRIGNISIVGLDNDNKNSGFLLLVDLSIINKLI